MKGGPDDDHDEMEHAVEAEVDDYQFHSLTFVGEDSSGDLRFVAAFRK